MSFTVTEVPTENYELAVLALSATSTTPTQSPERPTLSKLRTTVAIVAVVCSTLLASIVNGIFTIELPTIAASVDLDPRLLLWPQSIVALVSACTLLLCGSVSDVVGNKRTYLVGSFLQSAFVLATSLSRTGTQVLVFRAFMGLAQSMCLPSSTSIITNTFPIGRARNIAFACMGAGQPLGFSIGLVFGGVFTNVLSWRFGLYLVAGTNFTIVLMAALGLEEYRKSSIKSITSQLREDIDWFGVFLVSTSLAMLCYVLASLTADVTSIKKASSISLLCISAVAAPAFVLWMGHQARCGRPALIPNPLWRNLTFSSICLSVLFTWAGFNSFEQLISLWIQLLQGYSPLQTSIRLLPQTVVGIAVSVLLGLFVHRVHCSWIVGVSTVISLAAPLVMGVCNPHWVYWAAVFPAVGLNVVGADCLYTISNLLIVSSFQQEDHGLAGGVFNTIAQVGKSMGLALIAVITSTVMQAKASSGEANSLELGYHAGFWFCLALSVVALFVSLFGLRKAGKIGIKEE